MANKNITMLQLRSILQQKSLGKSNRQIAKFLHLSRETVNGYIQQFQQLDKTIEALLKLNDEELWSLFQKEVPEVKKDWRLDDLQQRIPSLYDELQKPHATRMILWEEYRQKIPDGYGYAQFCEHLGRFMETRKAVMILDHDPAASMMFDFAGDKIPLVDRHTGEVTWCLVLVCVLPFSGYIYVEAMLRATQLWLLKALNNAMSFFGGVPLSAKTDNMRQVVKKSNRYEPAFEDLAQQWSLHFGTTMMATRVRRPRDKASVESHVNVAYNRIYAPLRNKVFHDLDQMNQALWEELDRLNSRNLQRCDYSRRDRFILHEKSLLLPLPSEPFVPKTKVQAKVQRNSHVTLGQDWHHYSVPYIHVGKMVEIVYDTDHVEIYLNMVRIACYRRSYHKNGHTTLQEHLSPGQQYYTRIKGYDREYFIARATAVGINTVNAITKILDQKIFVEQTYNSCLGLLRLGDKYGKDRLEAACQRTLLGSRVTYMMVKNILERNLDKASPQTDILFTFPEHENIRGAASYQ
jgi:transposase